MLYVSDPGFYDLDLNSSIEDINHYMAFDIEEERIMNIIEYMTTDPEDEYERDIFRKIIFSGNEITLIFKERVVIISEERDIEYVLRYRNNLLYNYVIYIYCGDLKCYQFYKDLIVLLEKYGDKNT